jgi:hypothetical protein
MNIPAIVANEASAVCNTTRFEEAGYVSVMVSNNGREYTASREQFQVVLTSRSELQPWCGPELGGTAVIVHGIQLGRSALLRCSFGSAAASAAAPAAASADALDTLRCMSPRGLQLGWMAVVLSTKGGSSRARGSFFVYRALWLSAVTPPAGPVAGGTRVSVFGAAFSSIAMVECRFEPMTARSAVRRIESHQLECTAPPSPRTNRASRGVDEWAAVLRECRRLHVPTDRRHIVPVAAARRIGGRHARDGAWSRLLVIG